MWVFVALWVGFHLFISFRWMFFFKERILWSDRHIGWKSHKNWIMFSQYHSSYAFYRKRIVLSQYIPFLLSTSFYFNIFRFFESPIFLIESYIEEIFNYAYWTINSIEFLKNESPMNCNECGSQIFNVVNWSNLIGFNHCSTFVR